jgi:hypothetical protein
MKNETEVKSESKTVPVSIRFPIDIKSELDNAAYLVDRPATELVMEGLRLILARIRKDNGGTIPDRPRKRPSDPPLKRKKTS